MTETIQRQSEQELAEPPKFAVSERGKKLGVLESVVDEVLKLLAANGGNSKLTAQQLAEQGSPITYGQVRHWKTIGFPHRYLMMCEQLQRQIGEGLAGKALERAIEADAAQSEYIRKAVEKIDEVPAEHLAKNALALANAKASDIQMSQLLRDRPTEIQRVDVRGTIGVLERLGVVERNPKVVDAEVVEESDG